MQILNRDSLPLGGFAGLTEHRLVADRRVFGTRKPSNTFDGIGNFVYLADAKFNPKGETHMHPHREIDVISIMMEGQVTHEGSLEHGQSLVAGEAQVQRAGGEGFSHNEVNPDTTKNRMLQIWVLPDEKGQRAGYKHYKIQESGISRIYGGSKKQRETFDSTTTIDIVRLLKGQSYDFEQEALVYLSRGQASFEDNNSIFAGQEGDLVRSHKTEITAVEDCELIVVFGS